uniref:Uncharacterized protein n=1 Tax=Panagrolaimus sp. ES5 TaxID=591445 RepID=A0AC34F045_9BILA
MNARLSKNYHEYLNFNLNQNQKCSNLSPVQSHSKCFFNYKPLKLTLQESDYPQKERNFSSWGNYPKKLSSNCLNLVQEYDEEEKDSCNNKSTLSLHIAAYEDSIEDTGEESEGNLEKKDDQHEFPRQQEGNGTEEPEIMQFKASKKLLNPCQEAVPTYGCSDSTLFSDSTKWNLVTLNKDTINHFFSCLTKKYGNNVIILNLEDSIEQQIEALKKLLLLFKRDTLLVAAFHIVNKYTLGIFEMATLDAFYFNTTLPYDDELARHFCAVKNTLEEALTSHFHKEYKFKVASYEQAEALMNEQPWPERTAAHVCRIVEELCRSKSIKILHPFDIEEEEKRIKELIILTYPEWHISTPWYPTHQEVANTRRLLVWMEYEVAGGVNLFMEGDNIEMFF